MSEESATAMVLSCEFPPRLARKLVEMADTLAEDYDETAQSQRLADSCVALFGVSAAGVLLADQRGSLEAVAASDVAASRLDQLQVRAGRGPSMDAWRTGAPVRAGDLGAAARDWPLFAALARNGGFRSVDALPLRVREHAIGALALFGDGALPAADLRAACALADVAVIGIVREREMRTCRRLSEQLQHALDSRIVIEQAKGVLAHAGRISMADAFGSLRAYCRRRRERIGTVADALVRQAIAPEEVLAGKPGH
ncbi:GAF and ANTAR domain-containing protein [Amycolatopsis nivea]